jgi:NADPH-dependent glutamate synthase beta subunit-like oxidoreductase/ferredoxin
MPTLTIDGKTVEAADGDSLLQAASRAGIEIPTLCSHPDLAPLTTCFVCVVEDLDSGELVPACATRARTGLRIGTRTPAVHESRRTALELLLSDHVGECDAPCVAACPAGMDIPAMMAALATGDQREALRVVRERIPLAGVLGRVCPAFCERACRRAGLDEPLAICDLKRFCWDHAPQTESVPDMAPDSGRRVAVVGGGLAGMTAAWFLRQHGHACTLFEDRAELGGLLRWVAPSFHLPARVLAGEAERLAAIGVEVRTNWTLTSEQQLQDLVAEFDAVILTMGVARVPPPGPLQAERRVVSAFELLVALRSDESCDSLPPTVAVAGDRQEAAQVVRALLRKPGRQVLWILEKRLHRGLFAAPVLEELEHPRVQRLEGARIRGVAEGPDELVLSVRSGRELQEFRVGAFVEARERSLPIEVPELLGLPVSEGHVPVDPRTMSLGGSLFAAGEFATGPVPAVRAAESGRRAALAVDAYLQTGQALVPTEPYRHRLGRLSDDERARLYIGYSVKARRAGLTQALDQRLQSWAEAVKEVPGDSVPQEAGRCLQCSCRARDDCGLRRLAREYGAEQARETEDAKTMERLAIGPRLVFEPGKCILCGRCIATAENAGEGEYLTVVRRGLASRLECAFSPDWSQVLSPGVLRDCVERCPTGALYRRPEFAGDDEG